MSPFETRAQRITLALLIAVWLASLRLIVPLAGYVGRGLEAEWRGTPMPHLTGPCDFVMFWSAGQLIARGEPAKSYDPARIIEAEAATPAGGKIQLPWYYPPPALLLSALVRSLPFFPAFLLWQAGILAASLALLLWARLPWPVSLAAMASPAALLSLSLGQLGLLMAAALLAGLYRLDGKDWRSGALFGAMLVKPQAALLGPVALLARGHWRALLAGLALVLALALLTLALFGPAVWRAFIEQGLPLSQFMVRQPFPRHPPPIPTSYEFFGVSVFWMLRSFGATLALSYAVQGFCSLACCLLCFFAWRKNAPPVPRIAFTACLAVLALPYAFLYDLCLPSAALAGLVWQERRLTFADMLVWIWPVVGLALARSFYLELAPLALAFAAWRAWRAMRRAEGAPLARIAKKSDS